MSQCSQNIPHKFSPEVLGLCANTALVWVLLVVLVLLLDLHLGPVCSELSSFPVLACSGYVWRWSLVCLYRCPSTAIAAVWPWPGRHLHACALLCIPCGLYFSSWCYGGPSPSAVSPALPDPGSGCLSAPYHILPDLAPGLRWHWVFHMLKIWFPWKKKKREKEKKEEWMALWCQSLDLRSSSPVAFIPCATVIKLKNAVFKNIVSQVLLNCK